VKKKVKKILSNHVIVLFSKSSALCRQYDPIYLGLLKNGGILRVISINI
jgi:hypothetical protein